VSDGGSERGNGADHGTLYAYMETSQWNSFVQIIFANINGKSNLEL
jgi:hypothetical protein